LIKLCIGKLKLLKPIILTARLISMIKAYKIKSFLY
jgi:hypothetical protein